MFMFVTLLNKQNTWTFLSDKQYFSADTIFSWSLSFQNSTLDYESSDFSSVVYLILILGSQRSSTKKVGDGCWGQSRKRSGTHTQMIWWQVYWCDELRTGQPCSILCSFMQMIHEGYPQLLHQSHHHQQISLDRNRRPGSRNWSSEELVLQRITLFYIACRLLCSRWLLQTFREKEYLSLRLKTTKCI